MAKLRAALIGTENIARQHVTSAPERIAPRSSIVTFALTPRVIKKLKNPTLVPPTPATP